MKKINHSILIKASPQVIWEAIVDPIKYEAWTYVFTQGSYFEGTWNEGDSIRFLMINAEGKPEGMLSEIAKADYPHFISIRHLGYILNGVVDTTSEAVQAWAPSYENYSLKAMDDNTTEFSISMDAEESYADDIEKAWLEALPLLKALSEEAQSKPIHITLRSQTQADSKALWKAFTQPEHVMQWNFASEDWHCPKATNNLIEGGRFDYIMAAKDGSMSFDFWGTYTKIVPYESIEFQLGDDRTVSIDFIPSPQGVKVQETFMAEHANSYPLQRQGWQAILDRFVAYAESL